MEDTIRNLISEHILDDSSRKALAQTDNDESLIDAGLLDSLSLVQLVQHLEAAFKVQFEAMDMDIMNFENVEKIAELIQSKQ